MNGGVRLCEHCRLGGFATDWTRELEERIVATWA
ncbi:DUF7558 family protein [Salinigranum halophilum]